MTVVTVYMRECGNTLWRSRTDDPNPVYTVRCDCGWDTRCPTKGNAHLAIIRHRFWSQRPLPIILVDLVERPPGFEPLSSHVVYD